MNQHYNADSDLIGAFKVTCVMLFGWVGFFFLFFRLGFGMLTCLAGLNGGVFACSCFAVCLVRFPKSHNNPTGS